MKRAVVLGLGLVLIGLCSAAVAAPAAKTYQWTGKVTDVTDTKILVQKGEEIWEIAKDSDTKVTGDVKVGAKVTVTYRMFATAVEVKGAGDEVKTDATKKEEPKKETKKDAKK